jgi:hypothetical protein
MKTTRGSLAALASLMLLTACDLFGPGTNPRVSLSFSTRRPAGVVAGPSQAPAFGNAITGADTLKDGTNTLIINSAQLVLREIELEMTGVNCDLTGAQTKGCEDFETGPVLLDLPLGPGATQEVAVNVPEGTYVAVQFEIHKVTGDDPADAAFRSAHPDLVGKSIRLQGTFNGTAFTYETDLNVMQQLEFAKPLVVSSGTGATNLTIRVVLADWFKSPTGGLLDPATANKGQPNEGIVRENIKKSMQAFEDRDKDGD